jgi:hypothetical protein
MSIGLFVANGDTSLAPFLVPVSQMKRERKSRAKCSVSCSTAPVNRDRGIRGVPFNRRLNLDLCAYVNGVALDFNSWASNPQRGHRSLQREPPHAAPEPLMVPDLDDARSKMEDCGDTTTGPTEQIPDQVAKSRWQSQPAIMAKLETLI